jgi:hypothetical protein
VATILLRHRWPPFATGSFRGERARCIASERSDGEHSARHAAASRYRSAPAREHGVMPCKSSRIRTHSVDRRKIQRRVVHTVHQIRERD